MIMKNFKDLCKWSPTFVLATMFLAACSQSELVEDIAKGQNDNAPQAVEFGTFVGKNTRTTTGTTGGITTAEVLATSNGFGVFAYYTNAATYGNTATTGSQAPNFMYNQQVTGTGTPLTWSYTPLKYWPNDTSAGAVDGAGGATGSTAGGGKVSFFAYAPYVATATGDDGIIGMSANTSTYDPQITYKLPATPTESNTVDLLWGLRGDDSYSTAIGTAEEGAVGTTYNKDLTKQTVGEKVSFLFKHALAKFGGSASTATKGGIWVALDLDAVRTGTDNTGTADKEAATLVTLNSITIENAVDDAADPGVLYQGGVFDLATGTWVSKNTVFTFSDTESSATTGNKLNTAIAEPSTGLAYDNTTDNRWEVSGTAFSGVTTTLQQVYTGKDALYVIPSGADQSIKVTVTYTVRTYDGKVDGGYTEVPQTITKTLTVPGGLASNKQYRLNIFLGLTSVKFTASVAAWGDETGASGEAEDVKAIDLPINVSGD